MALWEAEQIPDADSLFYRVAVGWLKPGDIKIRPNLFKENKGSISTDWEKYSTAAQTRSRPGGGERFAVIRMVAGEVREIEGMTVVHSPVQNVSGQVDNQAHTSIFGLEASLGTIELGHKERVRTQLAQRFNTWEIPPGAPVE